MKKSSLWMLLTAAFTAAMSAPAFAEEAASGGGGGNTFTIIAIAAGFGMALASSVTGLAQSNAIRGAVEGIARNPGASGKILSTLLIGLAMIESLAIYVLVIALILLFGVGK